MLAPSFPLVLLAAAALLSPRALAQDTTALVSQSSTGQVALLPTGRSMIAGDGRFVLFETRSPSMSPLDANLFVDVLRRDLFTSQTELVSVRGDGSAAGDSVSFQADSSADGNIVVFTSFARNLVPGDSNGVPDVFLRDMDSGQTQRISVDEQGVQGGLGSRSPHVSRNGRFVVFSSEAQLTGADSNAFEDVYRLDRAQGQLVLVSVAADGSPAGGDSLTPRVSDDGRYVAFSSDATNLIPSDLNAREDVFLKDLVTGEVRRISESAAGAGTDGPVGSFDLSGSGDVVAFSCLGSNLVPNDTNAGWDVFTKDLATGTVERVNLQPNGLESSSPDVLGSQVRMTRDGDQVVFQSDASDLVLFDNNGFRDVFVADRRANLTERISITPDGTLTNARSGRPSISSDGRFVAFSSEASNLVPQSNAGVEQAYVRDRYGDGGLGTNFCVHRVNSSGSPGRMSATGTADIAANDITLTASSLAPETLAIFIASAQYGFVPNLGSSLGELCLAGPVGRFLGPGQAQNTGAAGTISIQLDLISLPQPSGTTTAMPGQTWHFQAWMRDSLGGQVSNNFTDGLAITF